VCYPKQTDKPLYKGLVTQCHSLGLPMLGVAEVLERDQLAYDIIVDALFGFSFKGEPRPPFDALLRKVAETTGAMIASIDIPSGWHVEKGDVGGSGLQPDMLISLTAPKLAARYFKVGAAVHVNSVVCGRPQEHSVVLRCQNHFRAGHVLNARRTGLVPKLSVRLLLQGRFHYLGGRFVPPSIIEKYSLVLPKYSGTSMCVKLTDDRQLELSQRRLDESLISGGLSKSELTAVRKSFPLLLYLSVYPPLTRNGIFRRILYTSFVLGWRKLVS
jgi:pyridoxal 5'-phosphate synthase / NAD(P)H-hydrate epimerase